MTPVSINYAGAVLLSRFRISFPEFVTVHVINARFVPSICAVWYNVADIRDVPYVFFDLPGIFYYGIDE